MGVPTYEGWLFLAAVIDYSRKIVGWSMRDGLERRWSSTRSRRRSPAASPSPASSITPIAARTSRSSSASACARPASRSRWAPRATANDNAVCESFHATLEKDLLRQRSFPTRQQARTAARLPLTRTVRKRTT
jgi:putative transposase